MSGSSKVEPQDPLMIIDTEFVSFKAVNWVDGFPKVLHARVKSKLFLELSSFTWYIYCTLFLIVCDHQKMCVFFQ